MHTVLESELATLLSVWRRHDDLRRRRASVRELGESRRQLDEIRDRVRELRRAMSPTDDEQRSAAATIMCESLGMPVTIPWLRASRHDGEIRFVCVCGVALSVGEDELDAGDRSVSRARGSGRR
jgi:hypothetical protein